MGGKRSRAGADEEESLRADADADADAKPKSKRACSETASRDRNREQERTRRDGHLLHRGDEAPTAATATTTGDPNRGDGYPERHTYGGDAYAVRDPLRGDLKQRGDAYPKPNRGRERCNSGDACSDRYPHRGRCHSGGGDSYPPAATATGISTATAATATGISTATAATATTAAPAATTASAMPTTSKFPASHRGDRTFLGEVQEPRGAPVSENQTSGGKTCLQLQNMFEKPVLEAFKSTKLKDEDFYFTIKAFVHQKCADFGPVEHLHIDRYKALVYIRFSSQRVAKMAQVAFDGFMYSENRLITATLVRKASTGQCSEDRRCVPGIQALEFCCEVLEGEDLHRTLKF
ncbi:hypothetical protein ACP4OV_025477 [Aristida adscensionis]